jgi:hypothetical protein
MVTHPLMTVADNGSESQPDPGHKPALIVTNLIRLAASH